MTFREIITATLLLPFFIISSVYSKEKGDTGIFKSSFRPVRDTYRYYALGNKGSSSLIPTAPTKTSKFHIEDAYGYRINTDRPSDMTSSMGLQDLIMDPSDLDEMMMAGTGYGGGSHYGGGGYGGGGKGCDRALGLLGVLGLAAYLQNVLQQMQEANQMRKKRSVDKYHDLNEIKNEGTSLSLKDHSPFKDVFQEVYPFLSIMGFAQDYPRILPVKCVLRPICYLNMILTAKVDEPLRLSTSKEISGKIGKMLSGSKPYFERRLIKRIIAHASTIGRKYRSSGKCDTFPHCKVLEVLPLQQQLNSIK